jgi:ATP-dependent Clp protease ATP-binding subunit ClpA
MGSVAGCTAGRQFPDKAIDLIDRACSTAKKMMRIGNQEEEVDVVKKTIIVAPNHVAEVGILFPMTCVHCSNQ